MTDSVGSVGSGLVGVGERFVSLRLSRSGKAVLLFDEDGLMWMTSVAWVRMLIEGRARNNMIKLVLAGRTSSSRFQPHRLKGLRSLSEGVDPLSYEGVKGLKDSDVLVDGDF